MNGTELRQNRSLPKTPIGPAIAPDLSSRLGRDRDFATTLCYSLRNGAVKKALDDHLLAKVFVIRALPRWLKGQEVVPDRFVKTFAQKNDSNALQWSSRSDVGGPR